MSNVTVIRGKGPRPELEQTRGAGARMKEGYESLSSMPSNISMAERHLSLAMGGALATLAVTSRRPLMGGLLGTLSAFLLSRGATGHCYLYESLGVEACDSIDGYCAPQDFEQSLARPEHKDIVDEASEESMVASDAPSHTPTTGTGGS